MERARWLKGEVSRDLRAADQPSMATPAVRETWVPKF